MSVKLVMTISLSNICEKVDLLIFQRSREDVCALMWTWVFVWHRDMCPCFDLAICEKFP